MKQALILIDIQNDYFKGGNMECVDMERAAANAKKILTEFRRKQYHVFHIQHISKRPGATYLLPGSNGVEINDVVAPRLDEPVITKHFPNSFRGTSLLNDLENAGIEEVVICGAMTQMCVDATARAAFDYGFTCTVIDDACATRDLKHKGETIEANKVHASFMAALSMPYAKVVSVDERRDAEA
jgi:nicotinamidase-related amidase